jgi:hypothetical protein
MKANGGKVKRKKSVVKAPKEVLFHISTATITPAIPMIDSSIPKNVPRSAVILPMTVPVFCGISSVCYFATFNKVNCKKVYFFTVRFYSVNRHL